MLIWKFSNSIFGTSSHIYLMFYSDAVLQFNPQLQVNFKKVIFLRWHLIRRWSIDDWLFSGLSESAALSKSQLETVPFLVNKDHFPTP